MKLITISREFGSGGRELGKRLSDMLGFDYYDREIITAIAQAEGKAEAYVEKALESHVWQQTPLTYRRSFAGGGGLLQAERAGLLMAQKRVIDGIAKAGRDCIIIGRDADILLAGERPFRIFVCADMEDKVRRCMERAPEGENLSRRAIEQNIRRIDRARAESREMISGSKWGKGGSYDLTVNTGGWGLKALAPAVAEFAVRWFAHVRR